MTATHPLDNPAWSSLTGPHARLAERSGRVLRYPPDMSPFMALPPSPRAEDWLSAAVLAGPGGMVPLAGHGAPPAGWQRTVLGEGVQLIDAGVAPAADPEAIALSSSDVPEMLALVERTKPGPFLPRTIELGSYLGIRRAGVLVAMAGERLHPPGWTEISAVCTDPVLRGQGLASRLVLAVAAGIRDRGEMPFLHALASNTSAIRLYQALGFRIRRTTPFVVVQVPAGPVPAQVPAG